MSDTINIYKEYEAPSGGGLYIKLEDGKPTKLRIASEPYIYLDVHKDPTTNKERVSTRYAWVAVNVTGQEPVAGVLRLPITGFKSLQAFAADDEYGDPMNYGITVTRKGTGKQTEYQIVPSPKAVPLNDEHKVLASFIELQKAIPNAITLVDAHNGKPLPNAQEPTAEKSDDVVIKDLPANIDIDLSDIPF